MIQLPPLDARIPAWNLDDLVERVCPVCAHAGDEPVYVRPDRLKVRRCALCTTWYVSPAPSPAQLEAFYSNYDETHRRDPERTPAALLAEYRRMSPSDDFRLRELASALPLKGARVLDVGFGRARMLYALKQMGAETHGVELDDRALEFARALGIPHLTKGTLDDLPEHAAFDAILLCDLVEHPLHPLDLLAAAARRLVPGGMLLVSTPNGAAADREREPTTFRVDLEHMQYFTPKSLGRAAADVGLSVAHMEAFGFADLAGIDRPHGRVTGPVAQIKESVRALPGYRALHRLRQGLFPGSIPNERDGTFILFALLAKPEVASA